MRSAKPARKGYLCHEMRNISSSSNRAKVENRSAPKIWRKLILGYLRGCVTFQRHWEGPWLILDETIWSPTSARAKCISGSENFRPSPQKDFCNNICQQRTRARQQITLLFDHLVGVEQEVVRDDKAQSLRRLE